MTLGEETVQGAGVFDRVDLCACGRAGGDVGCRSLWRESLEEEDDADEGNAWEGAGDEGDDEEELSSSLTPRTWVYQLIVWSACISKL